MSEDPSGWSLTESDPQVFTQLLRDLGVKGLQVVSCMRTSSPTSCRSCSLTSTDEQDDLYSLDPETLNTLKPVHALIFLFKYVGGDEGESASGVEVEPLECGVWFANQVGSAAKAWLSVWANLQVINNSCGTLAALNAVMNIKPESSSYPHESIELGVGFLHALSGP